MKYLLLIPTLSLFISCSSKETEFCDCLSAGEELNNYSSTLFDKEITEEIKNKMETLKENKNSKCEAYEMMSGEEMLELKKNCE